MPTGMKTGVFTRECGNLRSHALAFVTGHSAIIRKVSGETAERDFNEGMLVFEATRRADKHIFPCRLQCVGSVSVVDDTRRAEGCSL